jgi:hypothetical protein
MAHRRLHAAAPLIAAVALVALALAPVAEAHSSVFTTDGRYRLVIGLLNEPVVTGQKSGLDLCVQMNDTARTPLDIKVLDTVTVTLTAPDGQTLQKGLGVQFGRPGCFQFVTPQILTVPGQYLVAVTGTINGTTVDFHGVKAGGAVQDADAVSFPVPGPGLESRVSNLEAQAWMPNLGTIVVALALGIVGFLVGRARPRTK